MAAFNLNDEIAFNVLLGDTLDGKCVPLNQQKDALNDIFRYTKLANRPFHYAFGNHDYYCFSREELHRNMTPQELHETTTLGGPCSPKKLYYDFSPFPGWRFLMIDSYDVSLIGFSSEQNQQVAKDILAKNNPNDLNISGGWFTNLPVEKFRYVPYNGGVSVEQLEWLERVVARSATLDEKLICFSHQPIFAPNKPQSLIWNCEEILAILHKYQNAKLWMAGHDHDGQYAVDGTGMHHMVPPAPLECEYGEKAFGVMEVQRDRFVVHWTGKLPPAPLMPWPREMQF